jgi:uncharacterized membrane protein YgdD (TMEM256/DUF423 family)
MKVAAGILGFTGVALGAFGAHGLKAKLLASGMAEAWATGVLYHLVHALAVLATAALSASPPPERSSPWLSRAIWAWIIGVILFSGSLYLMALGAPKRLGVITPLGGIALLAGWSCLLASSRIAGKNSGS